MAGPSPPGENLGLPDDVMDFIKMHIHSVEQLEILLLLQRNPEKPWSVESVNSVIKSSVHSVDRRLNDLKERHLVERFRAGGTTFYKYSLESNFKKPIETLSVLYRTHSIRIIEVIYSNSHHRIDTFADAFLIRKK